jgi:VIT1/CCC1 family predicted Fe2+/Mn2+ transporter
MVILRGRTGCLDINDLIAIVYLAIPIISFIFGLMEAVEKQKGYGKSNEGNTGIQKASGILILLPAFVQIIPVLLLDISESYVWKFIVFVIALAILIFIVPRNFQTGLTSNKKIIPEGIKKYQFTCLKILFYFMIAYTAFKLVISKWFELL